MASSSSLFLDTIGKFQSWIQTWALQERPYMDDLYHVQIIDYCINQAEYYAPWYQGLSSSQPWLCATPQERATQMDQSDGLFRQRVHADYQDLLFQASLRQPTAQYTTGELTLPQQQPSTNVQPVEAPTTGQDYPSPTNGPSLDIDGLEIVAAGPSTAREDPAIQQIVMGPPAPVIVHGLLTPSPSTSPTASVRKPGLVIDLTKRVLKGEGQKYAKPLSTTEMMAELIHELKKGPDRDTSIRYRSPRGAVWTKKVWELEEMAWDMAENQKSNQDFEGCHSEQMQLAAYGREKFGVKPQEEKEAPATESVAEAAPASKRKRSDEPKGASSSGRPTKRAKPQPKPSVAAREPSPAPAASAPEAVQEEAPDEATIDRWIEEAMNADP